jgi:hypothetical protein
MAARDMCDEADVIGVASERTRENVNRVQRICSRGEKRRICEKTRDGGGDGVVWMRTRSRFSMRDGTGRCVDASILLPSLSVLAVELDRGQSL